MATKNKESKKKEIVKKINLDMGILEFLNLPEFKGKTRERNQKALRVIGGLYCAYDKDGIESLWDLKNYVEEKGWLFSRSYKIARFDHMGRESVEYFNKILKKYGLDPFGPLYRC